MATIRICDRCGAPVSGAIDDGLKSVVVPAASPSTTPVVQDTNVQLGLQRGSDLCDPCQVSALIELVLSRLGPVLTPQLLAAVSARVKDVQAIPAPLPIPAPTPVPAPMPVLVDAATDMTEPV
jgi:hypothetical protein